MIKIGLLDLEFAHISSLSGFSKPSMFEWDRETPYDNDIIVFTDRYLEYAKKIIGKKIVALLCEPIAIRPAIYKWAALNYIKFDYILTSNRELLNKIPNGIWAQTAGSWLYQEEWDIYSKNKNVSIIASYKRFTEGHILRHDIINKYRDKIDLICGNGYNHINSKLTALQDYRYQIVVENCDCPDYYTEKLLDCFLSGVIPIYWTSSDWIDEYFDRNGIINFNNIEDVGKILSYIKENGEHLYEILIESVRNNFKTAKTYGVVEDYLYNNIFLKWGKK